MAYNINKSDGSLLITVADGGINSNVTTIKLIGRNLTNYGEVLNENLVHLMENFSSSTSPLTPLEGQLWYDSTNNYLKVYDGSSWSIVGDFARDLGEYTVGGLPSAADNPNAYALATNASGGRTIVRSNGSSWKVVAVEGASVTT